MNISDKRLKQIRKFLGENNITDLSGAEESVESARHFRVHSYSSPSGIGSTLTIYLESDPNNPSFRENRRLISKFIRKFFNGYRLDIDILYPSMCPDVYVFPLNEIAHQDLINW